MTINSVAAMGLETAQGLNITVPFYWDRDEASRAWSKRFMERNNGVVPTYIMAGVYSAVTHYLNAVKTANSIDSMVVMKQLKSAPINDFAIRNGKIQEDGSLVHDMYLFEVKKPEESKGEWDLYKQVSTIPGAQAFKRPKGNECPLVKG